MTMNKTALITGANGQTGSYLCELLLDKGYKVYGLVRRSSVDTNERIYHLIDSANFELIVGDITDACLIYKLISEIKPDEVYNMAAMSHVGVSFNNPVSTFEIDTLGCLYFLEAIRLYSPHTRFLQASTSELFGSNYDNVIIDRQSVKCQNENTRFAPNSPYAVAKLAAHNLVGIYRDAYKLHCNASISHNHESPRRGINFVTKKITRYAAYVSMLTNHPNPNHTEFQMMKEKMEVSEKTYKNIPKLRLGNIYSYRDWSHARDVAYGQWLMLQQDYPDDYVFSSDEAHSVEEFLSETFKYIHVDNYKYYIDIDNNLFRPKEVEYLRGDSTKARNLLGWQPEVSFKELIKEMVEYDINELEKEQKNYEKKVSFQGVEV